MHISILIARPPPPHSVLFRVRICVFQPTPPPLFSKSPVCKVNTARPFSFVYEPFSAPPPPPLFSKSPVCKVNTGRPFSFVTKRTFWQHAWGPSVLGVGGGGGGGGGINSRLAKMCLFLLWRKFVLNACLPCLNYRKIILHMMSLDVKHIFLTNLIECNKSCFVCFNSNIYHLWMFSWHDFVQELEVINLSNIHFKFG